MVAYTKYELSNAPSYYLVDFLFNFSLFYTLIDFALEAILNLINKSKICLIRNILKMISWGS
jgi:hypothetical protein